MITDITISNKRTAQDELRITRDGIKFTINVLRFIDKDSMQWVMYSPSLHLSSYGETEDKARIMMKTALEDYCQYLWDMSKDQKLKELSSLGWKRNKFKNKQFSKVYVDASGELKDFNAVEDSVQRLTLETA